MVTYVVKVHVWCVVEKVVVGCGCERYGERDIKGNSTTVTYLVKVRVWCVVEEVVVGCVGVWVWVWVLWLERHQSERQDGHTSGQGECMVRESSFVCCHSYHL